MDPDNWPQLSSVSKKYLKLLEEQEKAEKMQEDAKQNQEKPGISSIGTSTENNEPILHKRTEQTNLEHQNDESMPSFMHSYRNALDSTDILIEESDIYYKPGTDQMSFMNPNAMRHDSLLSDGSAFDNNNTFNGSLSINSGCSDFITPPIKRFCDKPISFLAPSITEPGMTMDSFLINGNISHTRDLFNGKLFRDIDCETSSKRVPKSKINLTMSFADPIASEYSGQYGSTGELTERVFQLSQSHNTTTSSDASTSNQDILSGDENAMETSTKISKNIDTFYKAPLLMDAEKIEGFYKNHPLNDWDSSKNNIDSIMEPSLEYVAYRHKCLKPITTGSRKVNVNDEPDPFNCDFIPDSNEDIEQNFLNGAFVCSTPNVEDVDLNETEILSNPFEKAFINYMPELNNASNSNLPVESDDEDKTRSFLVTKPSENFDSALTHVSCSVPVNDEPQFDITTIFEFSDVENLDVDQNVDSEPSNDDELSRYELLISILNECNENPFAKTSVEMHETIKIAQCRKAIIMSQIEKITEALVNSLVKQESMLLKFHRIRDWKDCKYESNILTQKETAIKIKSLSFTNKNTERTFTIVVHLLGQIYTMLSQNTMCTKRELYYRDVELMKSQISVNKALDEICSLLNVQCWELGVLTTSKGLIAGDLKITTDDDEVIDYSTTNAVPQKPSTIKSMESNAEYILVVEKDTVFTRLMEDNIMDKIGRKIILATGRGYPDINTRLLLKKIVDELHIPIYIIVDADPHGIDIMCTYKYGSLQMLKFSEQLAIPKMEWIGIYPSDIEKLDITRVQLTDVDLKKVDELMVRPYINSYLERELICLKDRGLKAEIESIYHYSIDYLVHDYIPQKISLIPNPMEGIITDCNNFNENLF